MPPLFFAREGVVRSARLKKNHIRMAIEGSPTNPKKLMGLGQQVQHSSRKKKGRFC